MHLQSTISSLACFMGHYKCNHTYKSPHPQINNDSVQYWETVTPGGSEKTHETSALFPGEQVQCCAGFLVSWLSVAILTWDLVNTNLCVETEEMWPHSVASSLRVGFRQARRGLSWCQIPALNHSGVKGIGAQVADGLCSCCFMELLTQRHHYLNVIFIITIKD